MPDAIPPGALAGLLQALRVQLDADGSGAEVTRGEDDDLPVAAAQIVKQVILADAGEFQHFGGLPFPGRGERRVQLQRAGGVVIEVVDIVVRISKQQDLPSGQ